MKKGPECKGKNVRGMECGIITWDDSGYCAYHRPTQLESQTFTFNTIWKTIHSLIQEEVMTNVDKDYFHRELIRYHILSLKNK